VEKLNPALHLEGPTPASEPRSILRRGSQTSLPKKVTHLDTSTVAKRHEAIRRGTTGNQESRVKSASTAAPQHCSLGVLPVPSGVNPQASKFLASKSNPFPKEVSEVTYLTHDSISPHDSISHSSLESASSHDFPGASRSPSRPQTNRTDPSPDLTRSPSRPQTNRTDPSPDLTSSFNSDTSDVPTEETLENGSKGEFHDQADNVKK
jgi:hypothetical protein